MSYQKKDSPSMTQGSGIFLLRFPYGRARLRFHILLDY